MAYGDVGPVVLGEIAAAVYTSVILLDADGERAAFVFPVRRAGNITKIHFRTGTVTTGDTLKGSLQNVTSAGIPDDTIDQSGTVAVADGDDSVWKTITLGAARTVARGDIVAFVLEFNAFVAGNLNIARDNANVDTHTYACSRTAAGVWSKVAGAQGAACIIEYSDGVQVQPSQRGHVAASNISIDSATNPNQASLKFTLTAPLRVDFAKLVPSNTVGWGADFDVVIYNSAGGVVATKTYDADDDLAATDDAYVYFDTPVELEAGTYRLAVKPLSLTNIGFILYTEVVLGGIAQLPPGSTWIYSTKDGASAWVDDATARPSFYLGVSGVNDGAGSSAGLGMPSVGGRRR